MGDSDRGSRVLVWIVRGCIGLHRSFAKVVAYLNATAAVRLPTQFPVALQAICMCKSSTVGMGKTWDTSPIAARRMCARKQIEDRSLTFV